MNPATTPKVQYTYADGADNTVRPMALVYPNGRELHYNYGSTGEMDDAASRVASLIDDDGTTHLVDYSYLGRGGSAQSMNAPFGRGFVISDSPQPEVQWTMVDLAGTNDPDTGYIYSGFDRFGRVKDNRWYNYDALADVDRIQYGYNRAGNRIWRKNVVADALGKHFDELYGNDAIQRLKDLQRGTLNGSQTGVTDETYAECWSLDQTGNWQKYLQDDEGSGWNLNQSRTANTVNEITNITETAGPSWATPAYSKVGNMTTIPQPADPTKSFTATYDAWNRLVKLVDDTTTHTIATYQYDGAKRRVVEQAYSDSTLEDTRHCYFTEPSKWQVIEERLDSSTEAKQQHIWGLRYIDDIILRDRDTTGSGTLNERLYGLQDANWNVTCLIDSSGAAQERFAYYAYGQPMFLNGTFIPQSSSASGWDTLYAGYRWDEVADLFSVRNRTYNMMSGIWLQRDPLSHESGVNLYEYVLSQPLSLVDSNGLLPSWAVGCVVGGAISVGVGIWFGAGFSESVCRGVVGCLIGAFFSNFTIPYPSIAKCLLGAARAVASTLATALCINTCRDVGLSVHRLVCLLFSSVLNAIIGCAAGAGAAAGDLNEKLANIVITATTTLLGVDAAEACATLVD